MIRFKLILIWIVAMTTWHGCEHRELSEPIRKHFVRIYLDEHLRNVNYGFYDESKDKPEYRTPRMMRVALCNPTSGALMSEEYLHESGNDARGYYLQGFLSGEPGVYNLMAYNFDTESAHIKNPNSFRTTEVYTNPINAAEKAKLESVRANGNEPKEVIRYEPDHVFVSTIENVELKDVPGIDTLKTHRGTHPTATSVVKTYYMQVNVKGVEYVQSAVALITGMAGSTRLHDRTLMADNVATVYFPLRNGFTKNRAAEDVTVAYAYFNTFGKLPDVEGYIEITFEFKTRNNTVQTETIRVTDMFNTPMVRDNQWIIIDKTIEIKPPEGEDLEGGMRPGINNWEQIESGFTIG